MAEYTDVIVSGDDLRIFHEGDIVSGVWVGSSGFLMNSGGEVWNAQVVNGGRLVVFAGGIQYGGSIEVGGVLNVSSNGQMLGGTIAGRAYVSGVEVSDIYYLDEATPVGTATIDGVVVSGSATVKSGFQGVLNSGYASGAVVSAFGYQVLYSGGVAVDTDIACFGRQMVLSGGIASGAILESGIAAWNAGWQLVEGVAYDTVVYAYGDHFVRNGGVTWRSHIYDLAWQTLESGGTAFQTVVYSGGLQGVSAAAFASETVISRGGMQCVYSGGTAVDTNIDGVQLVKCGGEAVGNVLESMGSQSIYGMAISNTVSGGVQYVHSSAGAIEGGRLISNTILSGGSQVVDSGAAATINTITSGLQLIKGGEAVNNTFNGGSQFIQGGSACGNTLTDANQTVSGGIVSDTTILRGSQGVTRNGSALLNRIESGSQTVAGYASGNTVISGTQWITGSAVGNVLSGGKQVVNGGYASGTILHAASQVMYGGSAQLTSAWGGRLAISSGGVLESAWVSAGKTGIGSGSLISGGVFIGGGITVASGGTLAGAEVCSGAKLETYGGGSASDVRIAAGGSAYFYDSATYSGTMTVAAGGMARLGAITCTADFVFDLCDAAVSTDVLVNHYFAGSGYSVRIGGTMETGAYTLLSNAGSFAGAVTVTGADGGVLGDLEVGETGSFAGYDCTLSKNSGVLTLTVAETEPPPAAVEGDLNGDGIADVVLTISATEHEYFGATGAWLVDEQQYVSWLDLSTLTSGFALLGTGSTDAGSTADLYVVNESAHYVGAFVTGDNGAITGFITIYSGETEWMDCRPGDFNGDGVTDLLLRSTDGYLGWYAGGVFHGMLGLGSEWLVATVADVNADGVDDIVVQHEAGYVGAYLIDAAGEISWADLSTCDESTSIAGAGDFNGDGVDDILVQDGSYYGAWICGGGAVTGFMGIGTFEGASLQNIADFNGDGTDDLLLRSSDGDVGCQLILGADATEWHYYGSIGAEWSVDL